jgi:3-oxoacyl-[acyl-carrier protein] reductase
MGSFLQSVGNRAFSLTSLAAVSVGFVPTDLISRMPRQQQDIIRKENAAKSAAAARVGEPDDVAQVVAFLASESSKWVTGSTSSANGGTIII